MVEHSAVNRSVTGSSPVRGANINNDAADVSYFQKVVSSNLIVSSVKFSSVG